MGKIAIWLTKLFREMKVKYVCPTILFTDSANARATVLNPLNLGRTRSIDICYKWIMDRVNHKCNIELYYITINKMIVDGLIKPLEKGKHVPFVCGIGF